MFRLVTVDKTQCKTLPAPRPPLRSHFGSSMGVLRDALALALLMRTVCLRNLPPACSTEVLAVALAPWHPNFVLVIPDYEACASGCVASGYAFVNLQNEHCAKLLMNDLHGRAGIAWMWCWPQGRVINAA